jgi:excisionase family DNA binding protein
MTADELLQKILVEGEGRIGFRVAKAAELVDLGKSAMYELINQQKIKVVKIGKEMRVPATELLRLITIGTGE